MKKNAKIKDFSRHPYKGILKEIAAENGTSIQAVWNAINVHKNPRILTIAGEKAKQRENQVKEAMKALAC